MESFLGLDVGMGEEEREIGEETGENSGKGDGDKDREADWTGIYRETEANELLGEDDEEKERVDWGDGKGDGVKGGRETEEREYSSEVLLSLLGRSLLDFSVEINEGALKLGRPITVT
jgi:hypothetical protein